MPDRVEALRSVFDQGLSDDALVISGGVSAGRRDLVPEALAALGVETVFHRVRLRPGKPLLFGVGPARGDRPGALVFGLPGNPVSVLVGFLLFVGPALRALAGRPAAGARPVPRRLAEGFRHRGDRPTYHPARLDPEGRVAPLEWAGSADLRTVAQADGFAVFPAGDHDYESGATVDFLEPGWEAR